MLVNSGFPDQTTLQLLAYEALSKLWEEDAQALAKIVHPPMSEHLLTHGRGKKATQEISRTKMIGISSLTTYDIYGDSV